MKQNLKSAIFVIAAIGGALATATILSGCNRQEAVPVAATTTPAAPTPAAPATTVGTEIDDTIVTSRVKATLVADQQVKEFDIKVETRKGVVLLSGFVDSQARIDRVLADTRAVTGVKGVENGMTLKEGKATVGNSVDDSIVTTRVKAALLGEAGVKGIDIGVVTSKGKVQLSGFVDNQTQIDRAMSVTRAVEGAQSVVNEMSIKK